MKVYDTIIIGGGQAGLSVAFYLRRGQINFLILDDQEKAGGSWLSTWDSLRLFSPVQYSSLAGWMMPKGKVEYPSKDDFIDYLEKYEKRYNFPILRNTLVKNVIKDGLYFKIETEHDTFYTKTVVSATGTAQNPFIPQYQNQELYTGIYIHSVDYRSPNHFKDKKVLVVGGGNSGAQILAEVSKVAETKWVTQQEPHFLPEDIDGRYLFNAATEQFYNNSEKYSSPEKKASLSDIVVVSTVKEGLERGIYKAYRPFKTFYEKGVVWSNGTLEEFDAIIWCTGFKANLSHLSSLNIEENKRIKTKYTRSIQEPNLWLVGYGEWTGYASATIYGVGKTARHTAKEIIEALKNANNT